MISVIRSAAECIIANEEDRDTVLSRFEQAANSLETMSIEELVRSIGIASEEIEQEMEVGKVNILTMHRAKGLTAEAVIVVATEDQYIPGVAKGEEIGDERRLLYVSLTRARHHLFITYCDKRIGQQSHTGRDSGKVARSLTRFLVDCPYTPKDGRSFVSKYNGGATP